SEGGVALEGTEAMTLREAAKRFCTRPLNAPLLRANGPRGQAASPERAGTELEARLKELSRMREIAAEMRGLLERLE
ncbi:hypothetical protein, partial [Salmonella enterica]|uniref:hypothetical protein n=1 Tax=Salmonella enterica TaxID=28901 RepID=UPI0039E8D32C